MSERTRSDQANGVPHLPPPARAAEADAAVKGGRGKVVESCSCSYNSRGEITYDPNCSVHERYAY